MGRALTRETDKETGTMTFDAVRGVQAGKEFYSAMVSFKTIAEHFKFDDPSMAADLRAQRKIRETRVPKLASYITQNRDNYVFSSITVSVGGKMDFHPTPGLGELGRTGTLIISMNSPLLINDGQHRCAAIKEVFFKHTDFQNEKISFIWDSVITDIIGEENPKLVRGIKVKSITKNIESDINIDGLFVAIGHKPNTDLFTNKLDLDNEGYLKVSQQVYTSKKGVFAAGDVHDKTFRQAVTAAGYGCMAALEAEKYLELKK